MRSVLSLRWMESLIKRNKNTPRFYDQMLFVSFVFFRHSFTLFSGRIERTNKREKKEQKLINNEKCAKESTVFWLKHMHFKVFFLLYSSVSFFTQLFYFILLLFFNTKNRHSFVSILIRIRHTLIIAIFDGILFFSSFLCWFLCLDPLISCLPSCVVVQRVGLSVCTHSEAHEN